MENSEHDKLDELLELTRSNNKLLRAMHRRYVWGQVFTFIYWLIVLGIAGWTYYFVQPYLMKYLGMYEKILSTMNSVQGQNTQLPSDLEGVINAIQKSRQ